MKHKQFVGIGRILVMFVVIFAGLVAIRGSAIAIGTAQTPPFEVWLLDQSDNDDNDLDNDGITAEGGILYIYRGKLNGDVDPNPEVIDLAAAANAAGIGVAKRPHIVGFNVDATHAVIANVGSGDIQFMRIRDRTIVGNIGVLGQLHMVSPAPNSRQLAAVSIAQEELQIIRSNYRREQFELVSTVDLTTVTDRSGSTLLSLLGTETAKPICSNYTPDSRYLFITFAAGGVAIFDVGNLRTGPVLKEVYSAAEVPGSGCGLIQHPDGIRMYTNSGSKALGDAENVYVWNMWTVGNGVKDDLLKTIELLTPEESAVQYGDAHGPMFTNFGRYLWVAMRLDNEMKVIDTHTDELVDAFSIEGNTAPDVIDINPQNNRMFVSLRGYCPLSAINAFVDESFQDCPGDDATQISSPGRTPGLGIIQIHPNGKVGQLIQVLPTSNIDSSGFERTDPHGLKVVVPNPFGR